MSCRYCGSEAPCDCLDRIACEFAGLDGHIQCGWCYKHGKPHFMCGCLAPRKESQPHDDERKEQNDGP